MAKISIEGQKDLIKNLQKITKSATNNIEQALVDGGLIVERDAKFKVPVDTGRLRQSISHKTINFGSKNPAVVVGTNSEYAKHIEYGTSRQPAKPYLLPAFEGNKAKIKKEIKKAFQKGVGL